MNITDQLATALHRLHESYHGNPVPLDYEHATKALAAYDAAKRAPAEPCDDFDLAEPWDYSKLVHPAATRFLVFAVAEIGNEDAPVIASCREEANASHIVDCVNAVAGVRAYNDRLNSGDDPQPPTGEDYNALLEIIGARD